MITGIVRVTHQRSQVVTEESNITVRQPCKASITFYILLNKHRRLAKEGLVNVIGPLEYL